MLNSREVDQLNALQGFLSFIFTWQYKKFLICSQKIILLIYGNQGGKTGGTAHSYVLRILGQHPIAKKNVVYYECDNEHAVSPFKLPKDNKCPECEHELKIHERGSRVIRFCSQTLPGQTGVGEVEGGSAEVKNTQYPEFKKWLPHFLIKKDITVRNPAMIILDPLGGRDIVVEFISYSQQTQSTAGVQRMSIWCDEAPDPAFYEEQLPRLLAEDGDIIFTYTPVDRSSWLFDEFFEKAAIIYRTEKICDFLSTENNKVEAKEETESPHSIAVIMAATDDNPTLKSAVVESMYAHMDDPDTVAIRRYGIFKQISGRIFKDFDYRVHYLEKEKYFPDGIPSYWTHGRGIDYHPQTNWACGMIAISPQNEAFIYSEWNPSPEKYTTREICHELSTLAMDYKYRLSLVDPYAEAIKKDNVSIFNDLNKMFLDLKREGIGLGGIWRTWDTKSERGRDVIRERLKNSLNCERPFNNRITKDGKIMYLPTIWILNSCPVSAKSMKNWRWEEWADNKSAVMKEKKNKPEQKHSHFNMVWEALFKNPAFKPPVVNHGDGGRGSDYFRRER